MIVNRKSSFSLKKIKNKIEIIDSLMLCYGSQTELFKIKIILVFHAAHHKLNYMPYPYTVEFSNCLIFFAYFNAKIHR